MGSMRARAMLGRGTSQMPVFARLPSRSAAGMSYVPPRNIPKLPMGTFPAIPTRNCNVIPPTSHLDGFTSPSAMSASDVDEGHQSPGPVTQVTDSDGGVDLVKNEERDVEKFPTTTKNLGPIDIEHVYVEDDPRLWSRRKKNITLAYISYCSLAGATLGNI
jgi:hypothetical protein